MYARGRKRPREELGGRGATGREVCGWLQSVSMHYRRELAKETVLSIRGNAEEEVSRSVCVCVCVQEAGAR